MEKITSFFWFCSGADIEILKKCRTESSRYVGIGATIFFTGVFAALAAGYALYTVFDNVLLAVVFGMLWGLMIFNLDRYIVSSMRKEGRWSRELTMALPRIILAVIISIVIAKPLELKIFEKETNAELIVMEQETYARQEAKLKQRYTAAQDSLKAQISLLKDEISSKAAQRNTLQRLAQEEADGTGGSKRRNLGPIYKIKKADADRAEAELNSLVRQNTLRITALEKSASQNDSLMYSEIAALERGKLNGPAARIEALSRITAESSAIAIASWFIMLLFIALETAPVFVKLISSKGPYDNMLKIEEHNFAAQEIEVLAKTNAATKERSSSLPPHESGYVTERLDAALKRS